MPRELTASQVAQDRELLDRLGYGVLDIQSGSGVGFEDVRRHSYVVQPDLSPRATAMRLQSVLKRPFTEREARAAWNEILRYKAKRMSETQEDLPIEQVIREWDEKYGYGFRRRWFLSQPEAEARRYIPGGRERGPGPVSKVTGLVVPELKPLLEAGFDVVDVLFEAAKRPGRAASFVLRRVPKKERSKRYVRLIANLTGWTLSEEEAERAWGEILKHKIHLSEEAGHDVSMERAVVDYFKRLRLSGLDRSVLWETGQLLAPNHADYYDVETDESAPSTRPGRLFPA
ncbi:MAG: DUF4032 domain-containing protein [Chloroflexota bacterium]|nr:DUF4032 domain-containing protein [Chloroflexota bacterium]